MAAKLNLDKLDLQIIHYMMENAEISYADLGKKLFVSGGTIHVRIKKMQEAGIVTTTRKTRGDDIAAAMRALFRLGDDHIGLTTLKTHSQTLRLGFLPPVSGRPFIDVGGGRNDPLSAVQPCTEAAGQRTVVQVRRTPASGRQKTVCL